MALTFIPGSVGSYQCLSTDIVGGKVAGASYIGADLFVIDTQKWYRVLPDKTLAPLTTNVSGSGLVLSAGEAHIGQTGGTAYIATASFAGVGAATLHAANTHVAPLAGGVVTIPNAVRVNGGSAYIVDISLATSASNVVIVPRMHFYSASTVSLAPDSGSWVDLYADDVNDIGYYTMPAMTSSSGSATNSSKSTSIDNSVTNKAGILVTAAANSKNIYAAIETRTAFTTSASQLWNIKLRMDQN